jgi:hypothetical protein
MMRRSVIIGLILLNGLLAAAIFAPPTISQIIPLGLVDCCKTESSEFGPYCCQDCCWFVANCVFNEDCDTESN